MAFKLLQFLMDKYNFTYDIVSHDRNIIGSQEELNGSLIQSLYKNVSTNCVIFYIETSCKLNCVYPTELGNSSGFFTNFIGYARLYQIFGDNIGRRGVGDAYEASNNQRNWNGIVGTIHIECMDFDFGIAPNCWPIDLWHSYFTL